MHYILEAKTVVPIGDVLEWAKWFETADRKVAQTVLGNGRLVSTMFLGLNHRFGIGRPLIFETMVFTNGDDSSARHEELDCDRYSTWVEAIEGHNELVAKWEGDLEEAADE